MTIIRRRRRYAAVAAGLVASVAATALATAGTAAATTSGGGRGELVSVTPLRDLPGKSDVVTELFDDGFDTSSAHYGVRTYRLLYRTVDAFGRPTTASGLLAMPINGRRRLTAVSFTHGTASYRGDAPSMLPSGFEPAPAYAYASAGFATVAPDYLGLGKGPGMHPWMDVPSETTAALDMLRAARAYAEGHGRTLQRKVMVTGFSQGASAALGLGRALQANTDEWFRLGALAPISGAYDFRRAELPAVLDGELVRLNPDPRLGAKYAVIYGAYTLVALNRVHPFYASPAEVFTPAYAGTIQQLFDGDHTGEQLFNGTPATLDQLVNKHGLALLGHPTGGLATALRTADSVCAGWTPTAPTRLYMATGDEQAVNANTGHCQAMFAAEHRKVPVVDLGTPDYQGSRHSGSNVAGTAQIVQWFSRLAA
jgi:hypothetical protein